MELKKGIYFTIDTVIAAGIILVAIILASNIYVKELPNFHLNYLSQDLINILSTITIKEIENDYVNERISNGDITNLDNTILEQIGEFWADGNLEYANKTAANVTDLWISNITGFGLWFNNESIYNRDIPVRKALVSSKKMLSGIAKDQTGGLTRKNPPALWGPAIVEVRVWE